MFLDAGFDGASKGGKKAAFGWHISGCWKEPPENQENWCTIAGAGAKMPEHQHAISAEMCGCLEVIKAIVCIIRGFRVNFNAEGYVQRPPGVG